MFCFLCKCIAEIAAPIRQWFILSTVRGDGQTLEMRAARWMPYAQEVSALVHRQRQQPPDLFDQVLVAFRFKSGALR
jgi:hypothetical protein